MEPARQRRPSQEQIRADHRLTDPEPVRRPRGRLGDARVRGGARPGRRAGAGADASDGLGRDGAEDQALPGRRRRLSDRGWTRGRDVRRLALGAAGSRRPAVRPEARQVQGRRPQGEVRRGGDDRRHQDRPECDAARDQVLQRDGLLHRDERRTARARGVGSRCRGQARRRGSGGEGRPRRRLQGRRRLDLELRQPG